MLKIVFMGTPDFALPILKMIHESDHQVVAVVAQPDRPRGRGLKTIAPPVKQWALNVGLYVIQPGNSRDIEFLKTMEQISPDLIITAAYGQIISQALLDIPRLGCINVHASLLPKYRGASPIQSAILDGQTQTGITIFYMNACMDTGDVILQLPTPILPDENASILHDRLSALGTEAVRKVLDLFEAGRPNAYPQDHQEATYCKKIDSTMGKIDWTKKAFEINNLVRALTPWPGAYSTLNNKHVKINLVHETDFEGNYEPGLIVACNQASGMVVACGSGFLRIVRLQKAGGIVMNDVDFLRGYPISPMHTYLR